jgi:hypothetical protein
MRPIGRGTYSLLEVTVVRLEAWLNDQPRAVGYANRIAFGQRGIEG